MNLAVASIEHLPLPDESVDMIFTDPPYLRSYLPCYGHLAREAMRVLKPGGFVLAMAGGMYINQIFRLFDDAGLTYFWQFTHLSLNGEAPFVWARSVIAHAKAIIAYSKGDGKARIGGVHGAYTGRKDKAFHEWGQDVDSARYYIDNFSAPGDTVLDPFIGGGTTAVACELIGRRWLGFDVDPAAIETTRNRINGTAFPVDLPLLRLMEDA